MLSPPYSPGLSKWVKHRVQHESNFKQALVSLRQFAESMMRGDLDATVDESKASMR